MMSYNSLRGVAYNLMSKAKLTEKSSTIKPRHFSGPIGIFNMLYRSVYYGSLMQGIYLIVVITFSLGLINIMPLPVLDGGHIMIALVEMIIRRPIPHRLLQPVNAVFVVFLISFMVYVSFYDMVRLSSKDNDNGNGKKRSAAKPAVTAPAKPADKPAAPPPVATPSPATAK
jgi:regulator of sigma E protease